MVCNERHLQVLDLPGNSSIASICGADVRRIKTSVGSRLIGKDE
jgi:hypothetical protein